MKIKKLHIQNYKSLKNADLELNEDINVLLGKNNSGKSNLVDALMFLSWLIKHGTNIPEAIHNYGGGYKELVFGKNRSSKITFSINFALSGDDMASLLSELSKTGISLSKLEERIGNEARCTIELQEQGLRREEIQVSFDGNPNLYATGTYGSRNTYEHKIVNIQKIINDNDRGLKITESRSPSSSILNISHSPIRPEEKLNILIRDFIKSFTPLSPVRHSPEIIAVSGTFKLNPDGSNLPQVLNSISSSNRELFARIMNTARDIVGEIEELRAPLIEGKHDTYISMVEQPFEGEEFTWKHVASGTKEILYLTTLLHTTPKGSLLMIEEPEIHLHANAIVKFISLTNETCRADDKQALITTHSPTLIDELPFEKAFTVVKEAGETEVAPLRDNKETEKMLSQAGIPKSWLLQRKTPSFLLIVEGRDDVKIWNKFLEREKTDPTKIRAVASGEPGNYTKAIEMGSFLKRARVPTPFKIILDSDKKKEEKERKLKELEFRQNEYHILAKKEIEDYLIDAKAISQIIPESEEKVQDVITSTGGAGKEKLTKIFKSFNLSKPDDGVKELLAAHIDIPEELITIINEIKDSL